MQTIFKNIGIFENLKTTFLMLYNPTFHGSNVDEEQMSGLRDIKKHYLPAYACLLNLYRQVLGLYVVCRSGVNVIIKCKQ